MPRPSSHDRTLAIASVASCCLHAMRCHIAHPPLPPASPVPHSPATLVWCPDHCPRFREPQAWWALTITPCLIPAAPGAGACTVRWTRGQWTCLMPLFLLSWTRCESAIVTIPLIPTPTLSQSRSNVMISNLAVTPGCKPPAVNP